jgi:hypothetical protein
MNFIELQKMVEEMKMKKGDECMICHFPITDEKEKVTLKCKHTYHIKCFDVRKMKNIITCPYCNTSTKVVKKEVEKTIGKKCLVILKTGKNKGKQCNRINCGYHKHKSDSDSIEI